MPTIALHANWSAAGLGLPIAGGVGSTGIRSGSLGGSGAGTLHVWAEDLDLAGVDAPPLIPSAEGANHPFALSIERLITVLRTDPATFGLRPSMIRLDLPSIAGRPTPSVDLSAGDRTIDDTDELAGAMVADEAPDDAAVSAIAGGAGGGGGGLATKVATRLARFSVPTLAVPAVAVPALCAHISNLLAAEDAREEHVPAENAVGEVEVEPEFTVNGVVAAGDGASTTAGFSTDEMPRILEGASLRFYGHASRFVSWLLVQQRVIPTLVQDLSSSLRGLWQPWLADDFVASRLARLAAAMPASARCTTDQFKHESWPILEDFLVRVLDSQCRKIMLGENMVETIESRKETPDAHVIWLSGLLTGDDTVPAVGAQRPEMLKKVRQWVSGLDQRESGAPWRLCLRLTEPLDLSGVTEFAAPAGGLTWPLTFCLQSVENHSVLLDARDVWALPTESASVSGLRVDKPQELLLAELARASRLYKPLEEALKQSEPVELTLDTHQAYDFLREVRPVLVEQGFGVISPTWWESPSSRLGVRLRIESPDELPPTLGGAVSAAAAGAQVGLDTLVNYRWQVTIGDATLSLAEFEKLASLRSPLVLIGGRWVEVRPEDVKAAVEFIRENPGGRMEIGKALRLAYAADLRETGVPVLGMEATGWVASVFGDGQTNQSLPLLLPPESFVGSLRPYQIKGLSWLAFLDRFGLGACLADDMGLGKTIQLLAMLLHERQRERAMVAVGGAVSAGPNPHELRPTLLIVPMSVVGNWLRETKRFAPSLRVLVHHGVERLSGEALFVEAMQSDLVITTYALAHRDLDQLDKIPWGRIALDEAQNIKNPQAKQTQSIRSLDAPRRLALTGTPIENRLSELWSIMDFLNPGLLGSGSDFRRKFSVPIEKFHDPHRAKQLRGIVQPFVLRRLKTDPTVIADLPEKLETKEYCYLTPEQAALYESTVKGMLSQAEVAEGIQRRGVILAGLVKLKQICNHPHQYLKEHDSRHDATASSAEIGRSGKCVRLLQMLDEVVASGGQALVFTQFRQMGAILQGMVRASLQREVLFLHGGSTAKDRDAMVARFQKADGTSPIFILSLKAGGVGLNLTGANHVFHFDRWWNPAVESQATDRAFRIGQTRTVQVHKFVVSGTLEERIDQMIEQKSALADNVIGSGEAWLTELSLTQLRDVLALRPDAVGAED